MFAEAGLRVKVFSSTQRREGAEVAKIFSCHCEERQRRGNLYMLASTRLLRFARNDESVFYMVARME